MIALALILAPVALAPMIPEAVIKANQDACADPHYENALRTLHAAYERVEAGSTDVNDFGSAGFYRLVVTMGPTIASRLPEFQKPKVKSAGASETPTWVDAARLEISRACEEATYASIRGIFQRIRAGEIKALGLPETIDIENASPEDLFFEVVKATGSANTSFSTSERTFDGLHEDMKGKKCKVTFGYYAGSWRQLSAKAKEAAKAKAEKDAKAKPVAEAPAAEAGA